MGSNPVGALNFLLRFISAIAEIGALLRGSLLYLTKERKWEKDMPKLNQDTR